MMMKSVSARPRADGAADPRDLVRRAEFARAASVLDERLAKHALWPDAELRARLALKTDAASAISLLAKYRRLATGPLERAGAALVEGIAFARLGDADSATSRFDQATSLSTARSPAALALRCEIALQRAAALWIRRDLDAARLAAPALDDPRASEPLAIEIAVLHGAIAASSGHLGEQGAILLEAAARLRGQAAPSVLHRATVASQLSFLAREVPNGELARVARAEFDAIVWPAGGDLDDVRYKMLRSLAWTHAIAGDYFSAFRSLKAAALAAPSDAWRTMAMADRALLATSLDEPRFAEQEFDDARECAERVRWESLRGEERFALLALAELAAPRDASLALGYVARFRREGGTTDRVLTAADDRRVDAMESYSLGIVRAALGERDEAVRLFTRAWQTYHDIGYVFRAGRTAVALAALTRDAAWQNRAEQALAAFDRRWLSTPIERAFSAGRLATAEPVRAPVLERNDRLTASQEAVHALLLEGLDAEHVAERLGRSTNTVRNHIKAIYRAFGVRSRGALLARARRA